MKSNLLFRQTESFIVPIRPFNSDLQITERVCSEDIDFDEMALGRRAVAFNDAVLLLKIKNYSLNFNQKET